MSQVQCWECGKEFSKMEVFDIPVFGYFTVQWCFKCANKQLKGTDYKIIKREKAKYFYAFDKKIKKRVVHVLIKDNLVSMVTGTKQKFKRGKG